MPGQIDDRHRKLVAQHPQHFARADHALLDQDVRHLAAGGTYGGYLWSLAGDGTAEPLFPLVRSQRSRALFSFDHQWLVKSSWPNEIDLLNPTNGVVVHRWQLGPETLVDYLQPSPVTNTVFVPTGDGQLQIYSLTNGALLSTQSLLTDAGWGEEFRFSANGSRLLVMDPNGGFNGQAAVFSTSNWQLLRRVDVSGLRGLITPDGNRFAVASSADITQVWNVGDTADPIIIPAGGFLEFGATPDELWTLGKDGWVDHWQLSDGTLLGGVKIAETNYTGMLSPDKQLFLTSRRSRRDEPLKLWRSDTGDFVGQLAGTSVAAFTYFSASPDGRWVIGTRWDGSLVAFDFPIVLMDPSIVGEELRLQAAGAAGPFQLESRTPDSAVWQPVGAPFEGEATTPIGAEAVRYFRASRGD